MRSGQAIQENRGCAQQLAQQPQPALVVACDQGRASFREKQAVDVVVQSGPAGVATLHSEKALERPGKVSSQHQPVALGQEDVLEVLDALDAGSLHGEIADFGILEQVDLHRAIRVVILVLGSLLFWSLELRWFARQTDVALEGDLGLGSLEANLGLRLGRLRCGQRAGADRVDDQDRPIDQRDPVERW